MSRQDEPQRTVLAAQLVITNKKGGLVYWLMMAESLLVGSGCLLWICQSIDIEGTSMYSSLFKKICKQQVSLSVIWSIHPKNCKILVNHITKVNAEADPAADYMQLWQFRNGFLHDFLCSQEKQRGPLFLSLCMHFNFKLFQNGVCIRGLFISCTTETHARCTLVLKTLLPFPCALAWRGVSVWLMRSSREFPLAAWGGDAEKGSQSNLYTFLDRKRASQAGKYWPFASTYTPCPAALCPLVGDKGAHTHSYSYKNKLNFPCAALFFFWSQCFLEIVIFVAT